MVRRVTPSELRALFPALHRWTWLNAAASSPLATPVADAMRAFVTDTEQQGDMGFPKWLATLDALRAACATLTGAKPEQVGFVGSTSQAMGVVARQLQGRGITEAVTLEGEFPSTTVPLLHAGLTLRVVPRRPDGGFDADDIAKACTSSTGAIVCSAVQFASGFMVDLAALAQVATAKKLVLAVNAAQALGQVGFDVEAQRIDYLCAPSHKWLMGGWGVALLVARTPLDPRALPSAGWQSLPKDQVWNGLAGSALTPGDVATQARGIAIRSEASMVELGVPPFANHPAVLEAVKLLLAVGAPTIRAHVLALQLELRERVQRLGFKPTSPTVAERLGGICVVPVQGSPDDAVRALLGQGVASTARGGGLRLSTHVFNDRSDVERLEQALQRAAIRPGN